MYNRRKFIESAAALGIIGLLPSAVLAGTKSTLNNSESPPLPIILSTWSHGIAANAESMRILENGGTVVDAVEKGVMIPEADPNNRSVGLGGFPDRDGKVTLDASIMDQHGNAGGVCFLEDIVHPISVARKVMEETPHVLLAGDGALQFALENGFKRENLLTPESEKAWLKMIMEKNYEPRINWEEKHNELHDTIGLLAISQSADIAGACTTSGLGGKIRGRVGDSPIIGAGLFVDNEIGAATATGMGELVMKTLGSFLVVEFMRNGASPQEACEKAILRIVDKVNGYAKYQIGFIALNKKGEIGAYSLQPGFNYALYANGKNVLINADSYFPK
ncbi:MAG: N(4)-(beta-N-acetylglucosaminyl)-L-asparaginase [Chlorobi bacterium]|nr:N(4)-(beta-N-acetylglucosaminyl)-L-asparaginase [Chlorobiota bacterium]